ncbi:TPA: YlxR family protein [Candidatus Ventrenecus avicola]|nr:YlxR family protein [Candidatus Ventrenecus avicola]
MKTRKIPMRTCVVTREKCEKKELVRVVRTPEGTVEVDTTGKKNGKGAYLKLSFEVIQKARKNKALDRALEVEVPEVIYEELESMLKES